MVGKQILGVSACVFVVCGLGTLSMGQGEDRRTAGHFDVGSEKPKVPDEAKIITSIPRYELKSIEIDDLEKLPAPAVRLDFGAAEFSKVELPPEAMQILQHHWVAALKFFYSDAFDVPKRIQESIDRDNAWLMFCESTNLKLRSVKVQAPLGLRSLSNSEAENLWATINRIAADVVRQIKEKHRSMAKLKTVQFTKVS